MAKIMVVEDDNSLREIYTDSLQAEGYEVVSAANGEEALATAVKEKPDLIILDVMMPKISGFDVLDILRSTPETKGARIMMMTALSQQSDKERGKRLGADRYLVKSQVTIPDIIDNVDQLLNDDGQPTTASNQNNNQQSESVAPTLNVPNLPVDDTPAQNQPPQPTAQSEPVTPSNPPQATLQSSPDQQSPQSQPTAVQPQQSDSLRTAAPAPVQPPPMSSGPSTKQTAATTDRPDAAPAPKTEPTLKPESPRPTTVAQPQTSQQTNQTQQPQPTPTQQPSADTTIDDIANQPMPQKPKPETQQSQAVDSARDAVSKLAETSDEENQEVQQQVTEFAAKPLSEPTVETTTTNRQDDVEESLNAEIDAISNELADDTSSEDGEQNDTENDAASNTSPPATTQKPQQTTSRQSDFQDLPKLEPEKRSLSTSRLSPRDNSDDGADGASGDTATTQRRDTASAPPKLATPKNDRLSVVPPPASTAPSQPETVQPASQPPAQAQPTSTSTIQPQSQPNLTSPPQTNQNEQTAFNQPGDTISPNGPNYTANSTQSEETNPLIKPETNNGNPHDIAL